MAAAVKAAGKAQFRAVVGSDESEVKRAAKTLAAEMTPATGGDFGADVIDGCADNADQAVGKINKTIEALLTFPFFGGEKLVWLKNANFLGDSVSGRAASVIEALEQLTAALSAGLPEGTRFLLSAPEIDKRRTFYKTLQKLAKVEVFDRIDGSKNGWEEEAAALVQRRAEERDLTFSSEALEIFTVFTGGDRRAIESEIEKLDLYLFGSDRKVLLEHVRTLVPMSRAGIVFELGNALAERDLQRALGLLEQLLFEGESAIAIMLVAVIPTVRNLLLVKDLMVRHRLSRPAQPFFFGKSLERLPAEATAHLPRKKDGTVNAYSLGIAALHGHRYQVAELRIALDACLDVNVQLVTTSPDPKVALSQLLVRIITPAAAS